MLDILCAAFEMPPPAAPQAEDIFFVPQTIFLMLRRPRSGVSKHIVV
jgi:hypothetical protein